MKNSFLLPDSKDETPQGGGVFGGCSQHPENTVVYLDSPCYKEGLAQDVYKCVETFVTYFDGTSTDIRM